MLSFDGAKGEIHYEHELVSIKISDLSKIHTWITRMLVNSQNVIWTVQAPPVILENSLGAAKKENC